MGVLKQRDSREQAEGNLRLVHVSPNAEKPHWKFYLSYTVYRIPTDVVSTWGTIPTEVLQELSFGERRMIHYLAGHKDHVGCCYIKQKNVFTRRFKALRKLLKKGIVTFENKQGNIVWFRLADHFAKQKKFIIYNCKYLSDKDIHPTWRPGPFLRLLSTIF